MGKDKDEGGGMGGGDEEAAGMGRDAAAAGAEGGTPATTTKRILETIFSPVFTFLAGGGAHDAAGNSAAAVPTSPAAVRPAAARPGTGAAGLGASNENENPHAAAHVHVEDEDEDSYEDEEDFDPWYFIGNLPPLSVVQPPSRTAILPRRTRSCPGHFTLVLDLDETLVHSQLDLGPPSSSATSLSPSPKAGDPVPRDFQFEVECNGLHHLVSVRTRPYLHEFLSRAAELFEVVIFTASQRAYAERLLDVIDPGRQHIRHRIYRDHCVVVDGNFLKDLTVLGRDLSKTIIVDNSPQAFGFQLSNGIPIESWFDDDNDDELKRLLPFLERLAGLASNEDVRPHVVSRYRLHEKVNQAMI